MRSIEEILSKFEKSVVSNLDADNLAKIVEFLKQQKCPCIEEMIEDYLDLFAFDYEEFKEKYDVLNKKYDNLWYEVSNDMNILEEFYLV